MTKASPKAPACPPFVDATKVEWKLPPFGLTTAAALAEQSVWQRTQEYRRLAGRMQSLDGKKDDVRTRLPMGEYLVSRKYDGEFTVLYFRDGHACTLNPGGTVRVGLPLLDEAAQALRRAGVQHALIAGELYLRPTDTQRERVQAVCRAARKPAAMNDLDSLCFAAFDILDLDGPPPIQYAEVLAKLGRVFSPSGRVHVVPSVRAKTPAEIEAQYQAIVLTGGAEGLVLRSDSAGRFKLKPHHTLDCVVVGYTEALAREASAGGLLEDLLLALVRTDGSLQLIGHVSLGLSDEERKTLLSDLKDIACLSEHTEPSDQHVAYRFVRPQLVVELSCLDLLTQNTRGATHDRMALDFDKATDRYLSVRRMPSVSLISPVFLRRRDDKRADATAASLAQVADLVDLPHAEAPAKGVSLPKSQLLRREAYTKVQKGQTLVRKLVLWQTHKQDLGDHPAYVVHLTDFSPTRKTPLERVVRVTSSAEQAQQLWTALFDEYIVRGWTKAR